MDKGKLVDPASFLRRSPLYRWHAGEGANFVQLGDSAIVADYEREGTNSLQDPVRQLASCGLLDLTPLARIGFKGTGTLQAFEAMNFLIPEQANFAREDDDGTLVIRLSQQELMILDSVASSCGVIGDLRQQWTHNQAIGKGIDSFVLERADSHAWLALTGQYSAEVLSKVCAVDMRLHKFENYRVAQTSVARTNAIVIRADQAALPCFFVLADLSFCKFLWEGLLDAMDEFKGQPAGLLALQAYTKT